MLILVGAYKPKNRILLQLWGKRDDRPLFNKITSHHIFQKILQALRFELASARREIRNEKLESSKDVFWMWNQYLQDSCVPDSCMTWQLVRCWLYSEGIAYFRYLQNQENMG